MANHCTSVIEMYNFGEPSFATISGIPALQIIMIWFAEEATRHLPDQLSPTIVVNKPFAVGRAAFPKFPATCIMEIYTKRQTQTKEFCVLQIRSPPVLLQI